MPQIDIITFGSILQWSFFYFIMFSVIIYVLLLLPFLNILKSKKKEKVISIYIISLVIFYKMDILNIWDIPEYKKWLNSKITEYPWD